MLSCAQELSQKAYLSSKRVTEDEAAAIEVTIGADTARITTGVATVLTTVTTAVVIPETSDPSRETGLAPPVLKLQGS